MKTPRSTYRRLLGYTRPYRLRLVLGCSFGVLFGASHIGLLEAFRGMLKNFFERSELSFGQAFAIAAMLPVFGTLWGVGAFFSKYLVLWVGERVVMDLRVETFSRIQRLSLSYFTNHKTGELISRTTNDTMMVQRAVSDVLVDLVREPFTLVAMVGYIIWKNPGLAAVSLIVFPVCIAPTAIFGKHVRRLAREGQQRLSDLVSIIQENIIGTRIVKAFCTEEAELKRFSGRAHGVFRRAVKILMAQNSLEPITVCVSMVSLSAIFLYAWHVNMATDKLLTFGGAMFLLYKPIKKLSGIHLLLQQCSSSADRIFEILDAEAVESDDPDSVELTEPIREIVFTGVDFQYDETPVLKDINFTIRAGDCIALVGKSGAGKTTLMSLIPRFYEHCSGSILVNGQDLKSFSLESLRRQIGLVTQETVLFNSTVGENIAYGKSDASRDEIMRAAKAAHAHDFIMEFPEGYDTEIGDRGIRLSGGERQRLAIARAILANRSVLLLDEATSALDNESEQQVQAGLDELMKGRTVLMIAHRLSTIEKASRIIELSNGHIVADRVQQV